MVSSGIHIVDFNEAILCSNTNCSSIIVFCLLLFQSRSKQTQYSAGLEASIAPCSALLLKVFIFQICIEEILSYTVPLFSKSRRSVHNCYRRSATDFKNRFERWATRVDARRRIKGDRCTKDWLQYRRQQQRHLLILIFSRQFTC